MGLCCWLSVTCGPPRIEGVVSSPLGVEKNGIEEKILEEILIMRSVVSPIRCRTFTPVLLSLNFPRSTSASLIGSVILQFSFSMLHTTKKGCHTTFLQNGSPLAPLLSHQLHILQESFASQRRRDYS